MNSVWLVVSCNHVHSQQTWESAGQLSTLTCSLSPPLAQSYATSHLSFPFIIPHPNSLPHSSSSSLSTPSHLTLTPPYPYFFISSLLTLTSPYLMSGKSFRIEERLKTQSGEENSSSGRFNPVGRLQQTSAADC